MSTFIVLVHVLVCVALIFVVLLQTGKGADMGAAFGGGSSQTVFGSTGASSFLSKMTTGAAIVFMLTSLTLAYISSQKVGRTSIMPEATVPPPVAPAPETDTGAEMPAVPAVPMESTDAASEAAAPVATPPASEPVSSAPAPADTGGEKAPAAPDNEG